jgi:hypothetical protein
VTGILGSVIVSVSFQALVYLSLGLLKSWSA